MRREERDNRIQELEDAAAERGERVVIYVTHHKDCPFDREGYGCVCVPEFVEVSAE